MIEKILRKKVAGEVLDYPLVMSALGGYANPRAVVSRLLRQKVLIRVKKGLYVFGPDYANGPYRLEILANLVYGPSCVSLQWALSSYGVIPERVVEVTCVTPKRDKWFETPVGRFRYRYQRRSRYVLGVVRRVLEDGQAYLIAGPEKALVDLLTLEHKKFVPADWRELGAYLFDKLRCSQEGIFGLGLGRLREIAAVHSHPCARLLPELVRQGKARS